MGAVPNDGISDNYAFELAFKKAISNGVDTIIVPSGTYHFHEKIVMKNVSQNLVLIGESDSRLVLQNTDFLFISNLMEEVEFDGSLTINQSHIRLNHGSDYSEGDVFHISSNSSFENNWGYKENDLLEVSKVNGSRLRFNQGLLFNYTQEEGMTIRRYRPLTFGLVNIDILIDVTSNSKRLTGVTLQGMSFVAQGVSIKVRGGKEYYHRGIAISGAPSVNIKEMDLSRTEYGVLINYSANINIEEVYAYRCRHAIVPATATRDIVLDNIRGEYCQGVLDAHMAFNITANNIRDLKATAFSNTRAIGVQIKNSVFETTASVRQDYIYWSAQGLTKEYELYYNNHDVIFDNVKWVHDSPTHFNGLSVYSCRRLIVKNSTTHSVSCYGSLFDGAIVENSTVGSISLPTHDLSVRNSTLNGDIYKSTAYVVSVRGTGAVRFDSVIVKGYTSSYFLDKFYNTDHYNSFEFNDCQINSLLGWSSSVYYPGVRYRKLGVNNVHTSSGLLFNSPLLVENDFSGLFITSSKD